MRKPRSSVPADYSRLRLPRGKILSRVEAGARLRREHQDAAAAGTSIYEQRGLIVL